MPPPEYAQIESLILNASGYPGWCDFDVSTIPCWGTRATKGSPSIVIPHANGDLPVTVHRAALTFTMLGNVYGDSDLSGNPVVGIVEGRQHLADNLAALMALIDGTLKNFTYVCFDRSYVGQVTVVDMQSGSDPTDPDLAQKVALRLHLPAGLLTQVGS